jgi:hypothetical protein
MKSLKTRSTPILKNVIARWYGEITLKILKEKPIKSIKIKAHLNISIMCPLGIKNLTNERNIHFKKTFKNKVQFGYSSPKKFKFNFMISLFNPCLITINNSEWNSI